MAKVAIKSENITSFGGIFHIMDIYSHLGLGKLIDSTLGTRGLNGRLTLIVTSFRPAICAVAIASNQYTAASVFQTPK
jgi:hypothetical protein